MKRRAANEPYSQDEILRELKTLPGDIKLHGQRVSNWVHPDPAEAQVPASRSDNAVLALVKVWCTWAHETMDEGYWQGLLDRAHATGRRRAGAATSAAAARPAGDEEQRPALRSLAGLPADVPGFVGRRDERAELLTMLDPDAAGPAVAVVAGMAGVGKTALVVAVAYEAVRRGWFRGGVLFLDLCGYDPDDAVDAEQAVAMALRALGVRDEDLPPVRERATLYRSRLAELPGPVLVIADNASSSKQVLPLLPGLGTHRLLATSRHTIGALRGSRKVELDVLATEQSVELIGTALSQAHSSDQRVAQEPDQARRLAELCGWLPLALQIAAALLESDRPRTLAGLAAELDDERNRLTALKYHDPGLLGVRATLSLSYRHLDPAHRRLFRLLSVNPRHQVGEQARLFRQSSARLSPYISTEAAAILAAEPPAGTRLMLAELARAHLLEGTRWPRAVTPEQWRMHDLVLLYAREQAEAEANRDEAGQALIRLLHYYLETDFSTGVRADVEVDGQPAGRLEWRERLGDFVWAPVAPGTRGLQPPGFDWSEEEQAWVPADPTESLHAARAVDTAWRWGDRPVQGAALARYGLALSGEGRSEEAIDVLRQAVGIFRETGDAPAEGQTLINLAIALVETDRFDEAVDVFFRATEIARAGDDRHLEAKVLNNFSTVLRRMHRFDEAVSALRKAVGLFQEATDRRGEGAALVNLGFALRETSRLDEGMQCWRQAVTVFTAAGALAEAAGASRLVSG